MKAISVEEVMETLTTKLHLNQGQVAEVGSIVKGYLMRSKKLNQETKEGPDAGHSGASRQQMVFLREETIDQVAVFLKENQLEQFVELLPSLTRSKGPEGYGAFS